MGYKLKLVSLLLFFFLVTVLKSEAAIRQYKWEVKYEYKSPDCFRKLVITINGQSPGPTIEAKQGDTIIVEVKNSLLTENLAIHWHGIRQVTTNSQAFLAFHFSLCLSQHNKKFWFICTNFRLEHRLWTEQKG